MENLPQRRPLQRYMSLQKWRQRAAAEADLEQQEQEIRRKFKTNKLAKELGQLSAEELLNYPGLYTVMTYHLLLDSSLSRLQREVGANQKSHDFRILFNPPTELDPRRDYEAAFDELITMTYSWHNVAEKYNNNKLRLRKKDGA